VTAPAGPAEPLAAQQAATDASPDMVVPVVLAGLRSFDER
jgi:hypothetical protein